jgi:hypothetical protein
VIISDACMQVDVMKEQEGISKNRATESGEFYQYSRRRQLGWCNESETEDQRKISSI